MTIEQLNMRIARLEQENSKLHKRLERESITPQAQVQIYKAVVDSNLELAKLHLTGYLTNAAWRLFTKGVV